MPQKTKTDETHPVSRWRSFHFSGKVIICSVLFGFGFILIGGLVFAIGVNDSEDEKVEKNTDEMPTKAPSSIVGPIIMGIGGFIVTVGIIMCLVETQVCRKRKGDGSPLINERRTDSDIKVTDPTAIASTSRNHGGHHHKKSSPRGSKGTKKSHSSKHRVTAKSPSSVTSPIAIGSSRNFLSSSESNFHTPPSSLANDSVVLSSNSRDAENQTGTSLMKSFTSSGPSWNTSTEFRTPEASFKAVSLLETSVQTEDLESSSSTLNNPFIDTLRKVNTGFLTPITPPEETTVKIKAGIAEQKLENNLLVENSNQSMSFDKDQTKICSNTLNIENVKLVNYVPQSEIGNGNTFRSSIEKSNIEVIKEAMTDKSTHIVMRGNETDHTVSEEKDVEDILPDSEIKKKYLNTVSIISVPKENKLDENNEKMIKEKEESNGLRSTNRIDTFENLQHCIKENEIEVETETRINKLTSSEGIEPKEEKTISELDYERKTDNFHTDDIIVSERTKCIDREVEDHDIHSSENARSVVVCPTDEALWSEEQKDTVEPSMNNESDLHTNSRDSKLDSS